MTTKTKTLPIDKRIARLREWSDAYYNGTPAVSDAVFDTERDAVVEILDETDPNNPYLDEVGAPAPTGNTWPKFTHTTRMGSLFKVNNKADFLKWAAGKGPLFVTEKADGCTLAAYYEKGKLVTLATRGDGITGEDITGNAQYIQNLKLTLPQSPKLSVPFTGIIRGEAIIKLDAFQKHFVPLGTANPRNGASGKVRDTKNPALKRHITAIWFDIVSDELALPNTWRGRFKLIQSFGLRTLPYQSRMAGGAKPLDAEGVWKVYQDYVSTHRAALNYWIDGLVVRVADVDKHDSYGVTNNRPKGAKALKFPATAASTTLLGVEFNRAGAGRISAVGLVQPVQLDGTTVKRVSLHGIDWINKLGLAVGDTVSIIKAGEIIPYITKKIANGKGRKPIVYPTNCPECGVLLVRNKAYLECQNSACEGAVAGNLRKWMTKLQIKGIGDSILGNLIDDVGDVADLYEADVAVFIKAANGSKKTGSKLYQRVHQAEEVSLAVFLSGLNITSLGSTNGQRIASKFKTLDAVLAASVADLQTVDGIETNAPKIVKGLSDRSLLIQKLRKLLTIKDIQTGVFTGLTFCITGAMSSGKKRPEVAAWIKTHGGICKSGVDKSLTYLVTDTPNSGSSKNAKADKYGVKKITEAQLYALAPAKPKIIKVVKTKPAKSIRLSIKQEARDLFSPPLKGPGWLDIAPYSTGQYTVNGCSLIDPKIQGSKFGFSSWDDQVTDRDDGISPQSEHLNVSSHLVWDGDVILTDRKIKSPSLERLKDALKHITFCSWTESELPNG